MLLVALTARDAVVVTRPIVAVCAGREIVVAELFAAVHTRGCVVGAELVAAVCTGRDVSWAHNVVASGTYCGVIRADWITANVADDRVVRAVPAVAVGALRGVLSADDVAARLTSVRMGITDEILADRTDRSVVGASVAAAHKARLDVIGRVVAITVRTVGCVVRTELSLDIEGWDAVFGAKATVTDHALSSVVVAGWFGTGVTVTYMVGAVAGTVVGAGDEVVVTVEPITGLTLTTTERTHRFVVSRAMLSVGCTDASVTGTA